MGHQTRNQDALSNVIRNLRKLLTGKAVSALLQLTATLIMARALTPTDFGVVVLLQSYVLVWNGVFNCKPFEAIIRYGVPALERNDSTQLLRLLKLGMIIDVFSSIGATVFAVSCVGFVGRYFSWHEDLSQVAMLYSLILLAGMTGTAKGVLRLFNRFDLLSTQLAIAPILMFIGSSLAWYQGWGTHAFIMTWAIASVSDKLYMIVRGFGELNRQIPGARLFTTKVGPWRQAFPGIAAFTNVVYWQSNLDLVPKHGADLMVGALLGAESAGLYRLARGVSSILATPAVLLRQVLFPDLTRLWNSGADGFYWILTKTATTAAGLGLLLVAAVSVWGEALLIAVAGPDYAPAAIVMSWLLFAATLDLCSSIFRSAAYAMGNAGRVLRLNISTMLIYLACFIIACDLFGLIGPGVAATCASGVTFGGMLWLVLRGRS